MEIVNNNSTPPRYNGDKNAKSQLLGRPGNIFTGVVLVLVGIVWMLYNLDVIGEPVIDVIFSWQMLMIVIGGYLLALRNWTSGGIVAAIGIVFLVTDLLDVYISFNKIIMPLLFIGVGLALLLERRK